MAVKNLVSTALIDNIDQMRTEFNINLGERLADILHERKKIIAQNYFGQLSNEDLGEDNIQELSKDKLKKYISKSRHDAADARDDKVYGTYDNNPSYDEPNEKADKKIEKREKGLSMARSKVNKFGKAKVKAK